MIWYDGIAVGSGGLLGRSGGFKVVDIGYVVWCYGRFRVVDTGWVVYIEDVVWCYGRLDESSDFREGDIED